MKHYSETNVLSARKKSIRPTEVREEGPLSRKSVQYEYRKSIHASRRFSSFIYIGKLAEKEEQIEGLKLYIEQLRAKKQSLYADWEIIMDRLIKVRARNCILSKKYMEKYFTIETRSREDARQIRNTMFMYKNIKMMSLKQRFTKGITFTEIERNHRKLLANIKLHNRNRFEKLNVLMESRMEQKETELSENREFFWDYNDTCYAIRQQKALDLKTSLFRKQMNYDSELRYIIKRNKERFKRFDFYSNVEEILSVYRFVTSSIVQSVIYHIAELTEARYQYSLKAKERQRLKEKLTASTKRHSYLTERIRSLEQYYIYFRTLKHIKMRVRKVNEELVKQRIKSEVEKELLHLKNKEKREDLNRIQTDLTKAYMRTKIDLFKEMEIASKRAYEEYNFFTHYLKTVKHFWDLDFANDKRLKPTLSSDQINTKNPWNVPLMDNLQDYNQNLSVVLSYLRPNLFFNSIFENDKEVTLNFDKKDFTSVKDAIQKEEKLLYDMIKSDISQTLNNKSRSVRQMVTQAFDYSPGR